MNPSQIQSGLFFLAYWCIVMVLVISLTRKEREVRNDSELIIDKGNDWWGLYVFDTLLIIIAIIIFTPIYLWEKLFKKENDYHKEGWLRELEE